MGVKGLSKYLAFFVYCMHTLSTALGGVTAVMMVPTPILSLVRSPG